MATRRLVEGRSYAAPMPREVLRIGRTTPLVGRQYNQIHTVVSGQLVPQPPTLAQRQAILPGQIVLIANARRSSSRTALPASVATLPGTTSRDWGNNARIGVFASNVPYVVIANEDGYMRVTPLATFRGRSYGYGACQFTFGASRLDPVAYSGGDDAMPSSLMRSWISAAGTGAYQLARTRHVVRVLDPSEFPVAFYNEVRSRLRFEVANLMFDRLAAMATQGLRDSDWRQSHSARSRLARSKGGMRVGRELRSLRVNNDEGVYTQNEVMGELRDAYSSIKRLVELRGSLGDRDSGDVALAAVQRWASKMGFGTLQYATGCGHMHTGTNVLSVISSWGLNSPETYCPACAADHILVTQADGSRIHAINTLRRYNWDDGTVRLYSQPSIIGGRHSGKHVIGFVPPLKPVTVGYRTLGLELEMQAYNGFEKSEMARAMHAQLRSANLLDAAQHSKYLHFEEDGSTGQGGFEMVTGYTDIATHQTLLRALLSKDNGEPAYEGKLRSHNAAGQSCGIHVHIAKPKSLIHAMKMRQFINSIDNQGLVKSIARRYSSSGYAKVLNELADTPAGKQAAAQFKDAKRFGQSLRLSATSAINRINRNDRYEALNFQNAATVEFRIFRGSMLFTTVMACMEFTLAVYDFCKETTAERLNTAEFLAFVGRCENRAETASLRKYLKAKGYDVPVPKRKPVAPYVPSAESVADAATRDPVVWTPQPV